MTDLGEILKKQRQESEERDAKRRAEKLGLPYLDLITTTTPTEFKAMAKIKESEARKAKVVPVQLIGKKMTLAAYDPNTREAQEVIEKFKKDYDLSLAVASTSGLEHVWDHYKHIGEKGEEISGSITINLEKIERIEKEVSSIKGLEDALENNNEMKTSDLVDMVIGGAMALKASDIHIESGKDTNDLRLRIDGILHTITNLSKNSQKALIMRIKLLSDLKLNVKSEPQDGRFTMSLPDRDIELRVSTIPSEYGETVVLRLLDPTSLKTELKDLGWRKDDLEIIEKELKRPTGLVLNTGPTGSGKTTTLYAFLKNLISPEIKIITIEEPIEYHIKGISQTQTNKETGYTFAKGLRAIVRQDPDVILVGEIRDKETSDIAMQASLTGHKVFSTLHTNSASGAIPRLIDLGVNINSIGSALNLVIAQRLIRKLCEHCKKQVTIKGEVEKSIKNILNNLPERVKEDDRIIPENNFVVYEAAGCKECNDLGYQGRIGIFELFLITEEVESMIKDNPAEVDLFKKAKEQGMVTMQEDGIMKVLKGKTSLNEVEKATGPIEII